MRLLHWICLPTVDVSNFGDLPAAPQFGWLSSGLKNLWLGQISPRAWLSTRPSMTSLAM